MNKVLLFISFLCISQVFAELHPPDNSTLNYIHIMFKWDAIDNINEYEFALSNNNFSTTLVSTTVNDTQYLETNHINWQSSYQWRFRAVGNAWSNTINFSTGTTLSDVSVIMYDDNNYADGYTIFGSADGTYSAIIDKMGNEIWNSADQNIIYYNFDENGSFFGARYDGTLENEYPGIKFSLSDGIVWEEPNTDLVHHEFIELPWGDYMGIAHEYQNGPIYATNTNILYWYLMLGFSLDGTDEWPWQGDRLIIWDKDTKAEKWSWSTFDHFNMIDYDANQWNQNPEVGGQFDWTHVNAFVFETGDNCSPQDSCIYISSRNLSRITKIQYPSGDIIWNMGRESVSEDVTFGHNLDFSYQHSISLTDAGNILILDNGNYSMDYWSADALTTRALEISVSADQSSAVIAWQYILPGNLFGSTAGNVQQLANGNYLITTVGNQGTTLEVTFSGALVWEANYSSYLMWRASRIENLYPDMTGSLSNSVSTLINHFKLNVLYPNPFNPVVNIEYEMSTYSFLTVDVLNINGQLIEIINAGYQYPGKHSIEWNAASRSSGMYIIRIRNKNQFYTQKIMLVK